MANGGVLTDNGKVQILKLMYGTSGILPFSKAIVGTGTTTPAATDTGAEKPFALSGTTVDLCDAITGWSATADGSVTLNTTAGQFVEGTGALNLVKSGTANASVTFSKTTSSVDFTSKRLQVMFYVADKTKLAVTTGLEIRFGSDASNYYYKRYNQADLSNGWNYLFFTSASATGTTGSPAITACDYTAFVVAYTGASTTVAAPDMRIDNIILSNVGTNDQISFLAGYPTFDAATKTVTNRIFLNSTQANGVPLTEIVECDTSGNILGHDVHDVVSKTSSIEVTYIITHQIT